MSVRVRLTLWYTAILAVVMIGFAVASDLVIVRATEDAVEGLLASASDALVAELASEDPSARAAAAAAAAPAPSEEEEDADEGDEEDEADNDALGARLEPPTTPDPGGPERAAIVEATNDLRFTGVGFAVLDEGGRLVASTGLFRDQAIAPEGSDPLPQVREVVAAAMRDGVAATTVRNGFAPVRVRVQAATFADRCVALVVSRSLADQEAMLGRVRQSYSLAVPFALLLAALGGHVLVRKSLAPVAEMGARADAIEASSLDRRLPVLADDEFGRLARAFNRLLGRLERSFAQQRRFMADASHELRTPVAIVRGEAEVALSQPHRPAEAYREALSIVHDEGRRLTRIVEDLFMLARADTGRHPHASTEFYLDETVADSARAVRTLASRRGLAVRCETGDEMPFRGDETLISRMLVNLLDNAIKHTPSGGEVALRAVRENGDYRVTLTDTGTGIPPEAQPHVFDRFFRADPARSRVAEGDGSGAGLGLSIARWIAESHGGRLDLVRSDASGSTFEISLPVNGARG